MSDEEQRLLSKIITTGDLMGALTAGVTGRHFHDLEFGGVWDWATAHLEKHKKCPDLVTVRAEYGNYKILEVPEPLGYYVGALLEAHKRFETLDLLGGAAQLVQNSDVDGALGLINERLIELEQAVSVSDDEDLTAGFESRLAYYRMLDESGGDLVGIPTGFTTFDLVTGGFQGEQFIVLIGPQKAGKSGMLLRMAIAASDAAYKVLFVGFEMTNREQGARYDGLRAGFNYNKMLHAKMLPADWKKLDREVRRHANNPPLTLVHDASITLSGLAAKVLQYKPDIVFVDGVYMMDSEIPGVEPMDTRSLTKISRGLKRLGQNHKIPVVCTSQALDWKWNPKQGLTTKAAGYTSAFGQDCDWMLGVEPPDEENVAKVRLITGRTAGRQLILVAFDWDHGSIEEQESWDTTDDAGDDSAIVES